MKRLAELFCSGTAINPTRSQVPQFWKEFSTTSFMAFLQDEGRFIRILNAYPRLNYVSNASCDRLQFCCKEEIPTGD